MTTTDGNGIIFLEETDPISPFHTLMNTLQQGTSDSLQAARRGPLYAADNTARTALYTQYGASPSAPLWVNVAGVIQYTVDGTNWIFATPRYIFRDADGTSMPTTVRPLEQAFVVQDVTNGSSVMTIPFPVAFTVKPIVHAMTVSGAAINPVVNANSITTSQVSLIWPGNPSANIRVHITARGW